MHFLFAVEQQQQQQEEKGAHVNGESAVRLQLCNGKFISPLSQGLNKLLRVNI